MTDPTPGAYATIADLRAATNDPSIPDSDPIATRLIQFASAKIDEYCGQSFPTTEGGVVPLIVTSVCAAVAGRAWQNPGGAQSTTESSGPYTFGTTFGSGQSSASVPMALRASEKDDLSRYKVRRSGISTIATYRPVPLSAERYLNPSGGGKPFPRPNPDEL
jgi:hypothetical protein